MVHPVSLQVEDRPGEFVNLRCPALKKTYVRSRAVAHVAGEIRGQISVRPARRHHRDDNSKDEDPSEP